MFELRSKKRSIYCYPRDFLLRPLNRILSAKATTWNLVGARLAASSLMAHLATNLSYLSESRWVGILAIFCGCAPRRSEMVDWGLSISSLQNPAFCLHELYRAPTESTALAQYPSRIWCVFTNNCGSCDGEKWWCCPESMPIIRTGCGVDRL